MKVQVAFSIPDQYLPAAGMTPKVFKGGTYGFHIELPFNIAPHAINDAILDALVRLREEVQNDPGNRTRELRR